MITVFDCLVILFYFRMHPVPILRALPIVVAAAAPVVVIAIDGAIPFFFLARGP
jgi:hypothetical protein